MKGRFVVRMQVANPGAARRLFEESFGWRPAPDAPGSPLTLTPPVQFVPMLELIQPTGSGALGLLCLHYEVDALDPLLDRLTWLEMAEPRTEAPPGRDIVGLRWPGWSFYVALFANKNGYWRDPHGQRFVALGLVPNLAAARDSLRARGWRTVREWSNPSGKGAYLAPPELTDIQVHIESSSSSSERLLVEVTDPAGPPPQAMPTIPGVALPPS